MVVPFPPGGGTFLAGRIVADRLQARIGKPVVVENRAGANGNIATVAVARSPSDGYTLLFASTTHVINPSLYANIAFDPVKDFTPLSLVASTPPILVAHPRSRRAICRSWSPCMAGKPRNVVWLDRGRDRTASRR